MAKKKDNRNMKFIIIAIIVVIVALVLVYNIGAQQGSQPQPTQPNVNFPTFDVKLLDCSWSDFSKISAYTQGRYWFFFNITNAGQETIKPNGGEIYLTSDVSSPNVIESPYMITNYVPVGNSIGSSQWGGAIEFYINDVYPRKDFNIQLVYQESNQKKIIYVGTTNGCKSV